MPSAHAPSLLACRRRPQVASAGQGLAFRGMTNPLRERHHEDKQAKKNVWCTKIGMVEFELRPDFGSKLDGSQGKRGAW
ncbi:hypothetical protein BHE74_00041743 [Ensete ventricosum]|nr:hypothetical protein BHE74_00041743 [Ensete ventricosum]